MSILNLLKKDHAKVRELYQKLQAEKSSTLEKSKMLFNQLKREIVVHSEAEEQCFYQPITKHKMGKELIQHALKEHKQVEAMLNQMEKIAQKDEKATQQDKEFLSTLEALIKELEHHIHEEEGQIFKKAEEFFDNKALKKMGEEFIYKKEKIEMEMRKTER